MIRDSKYHLEAVAAICFGLVPLSGFAFNSGSTGADGAFNPTVNTELQLPPTGVFNFTSVNIPNGVTVTFRRNAANTPAVMLVQGDAVIAGTISVAGGNSPDTGRSGDGNITDDGNPGRGGPGGFDGGTGGQPPNGSAGAGLGPGGGQGAKYRNGCGMVGAGGGYASAGQSATDCGNNSSIGGPAYGTSTLLPLIGGSGGGGGAGGISFAGSGGGGGGGALLIAASGTVTLSGRIIADGGKSGAYDSSSGIYTYRGGGGSGGAVRIIASKLQGAGQVSAQGGQGHCPCLSGMGSEGRVRLEAETFTFTGSTAPYYNIIATPGTPFVPNLPGLRIATIGGFAVPAQPTGNADVTLPVGAPNPVTIVVQSHSVPVGAVVKVRVLSQSGAGAIYADSPPTTGTVETASTSVALNIPDGASVIEAETTFTVTADLEKRLAPYAQGEAVERVRLTTEPGQRSKIMLLTASGREVEAPAAAQANGW